MSEPQQPTFRKWLLNGVLTCARGLWRVVRFLIHLPVSAVKYLSKFPRDAWEFAIGIVGLCVSLIFLCVWLIRLIFGEVSLLSLETFILIVIGGFSILVLLHVFYLDDISPLVCPHCGFTDSVKQVRCSKCGKVKRRECFQT
jgi:hypothetical protein